MSARPAPSLALYTALQAAFDHFNATLFEGSLAPVMFTLQKQPGMMGYFAPERWLASDDGTRHPEIAINPMYLARSRLVGVFQTLVHEMVHLWQAQYGCPSRSNYHNREWAQKMIAVGLQPSDTGRPGGKITGQRMSDYPLPGGAFLRSCESLMKEKRFALPMVYRLVYRAAPDEGASTALPLGLDSDVEEQLNLALFTVLPEGAFATSEPSVAKRKVRYACPGCKTLVWGKPGIDIACNPCGLNYTSG